MRSQRCTPEFNNEAARKITERDYSATEVSERPGTSSYSRYKWVKAV